LNSVFIVRSDHSELLSQSSGKRGRQVKLNITCVGGTGSHFISTVWGREEERGEETEGHARIIRIIGKSEIIHTWHQTGLTIILLLGKMT
jgi:hypothetical protein